MRPYNPPSAHYFEVLRFERIFPDRRQYEISQLDFSIELRMNNLQISLLIAILIVQNILY